jgi:Ala-tRNA(Pro) deacylase
MPVGALTEFLDRNNVRYVTITHSIAYTAQGIAALTHTRGRELAKTVMVKVDGRLAMAVVPASWHVSLELLKEGAGANTVGLASEGDFFGRFPGCETGAMPPFGNLYDMAVFVDEGLAREKEIAFNAGTHRELIRMSYEDFDRLVKPRMLKLVAGRAGAHAA